MDLVLGMGMEQLLHGHQRGNDGWRGATAKLLLLQLLLLVWLLGWTGIGRGTLMLLLLLTGSTTGVFGRWRTIIAILNFFKI
jgi:hypothetical protein